MAPNQVQNSPYTKEQLNAYFSRISFPVTKYPTITPEIARSHDGLEYLAALQKYQLASVPFENLALHYSREKVVSIDKEDLFEKIVGRNQGRGGYCMENNFFFECVLKSLGFEVVPTGARVTVGDGMTGWGHSVNLVIIAGQPYLVDVGYGGNCATRPMPLIHNQVFKWGATNAETRLRYQEPSNPIVQGLWALEHRISPSHPWTTSYSFTMTEFVPQDFDVMNWARSTQKTSFFTYKIICVKMVWDEEVEDLVGVVILENQKFKKRINGEVKDTFECKSEDERVNVLSEHFGIKFAERERVGIQGSVTELR